MASMSMLALLALALIAAAPSVQGCNLAGHLPGASMSNRSRQMEASLVNRFDTCMKASSNIVVQRCSVMQHALFSCSYVCDSAA